MFEIKIMDDKYSFFIFRSKLMSDLTSLAADMMMLNPKICYELKVIPEEEGDK